MDGAWKLSTTPDCMNLGYRLGEEEHIGNKMDWRRIAFPKAAPLPTHPTLSHYCFPSTSPTFPTPAHLEEEEFSVSIRVLGLISLLAGKD